MLILVKQIMRRNTLVKTIFLAICFFFLSAYPIYKNYMNGEAIATYDLNKRIIEKDSKFYNPWQYRILCPLMIEGIKRAYDHTIDKIFPIQKIIHFNFHSTSGFTPETQKFLQQLNNPDIVKYILIFLIFRFVEDFLLLSLSFYLLSYFIKNRWLVFIGLILISWSMGNGVIASDLTFNTYLDNILYLLAGCVILYKKDPWFILPITIIGALNRETSLLIPFLYYVSNINFSLPLFTHENLKKIIRPSQKTFLISLLSLISFVILFIGLRIYFGYRPQGEWKVPAGIPMLRLNLFSFVAIKGYFEMFGAFSVLPLICLYKFKRCSLILQVWFIAIVPIWFFVHFYSVPAYESRLFFVPTFLIFIPMVLEIIHKNGNRGNISINKSTGPTAQYISE
jgi:hypothetical protein